MPSASNTRAVQGQSVLVVQGVNGDPTTGATHFAYGEDGTLAYVAGPAEVGRLRLMWIDYQGVARPTLDPSSVPVGYRDPKLSPDKRRVAATVFSGSAHDIWLYDLTRRTEMRFTFGALGGEPTGAVHVDNVTRPAVSGVSPAEDAERPEAIRVVLGWRSDLRRWLGLGSGRVF